MDEKILKEVETAKAKFDMALKARDEIYCKKGYDKGAKAIFALWESGISLAEAKKKLENGDLYGDMKKHLNEGLRIMKENMDDFVYIIRHEDEPEQKLKSKYNLSDDQVEYIFNQPEGLHKISFI